MNILGDYSSAVQCIGTLSLVLLTQKTHIILPAAYFGKLKKAISISLNSRLSHYSPEFNGVPVAFNNSKVRLLSNLGNIIAEQSEVHFDVEVDYIVFQPKLGDLLNGIVNKIISGSRSSFGCLVHGFFYVVVCCNAKKMPEVGDKVWFEVTSLEDDGNGYLQIVGLFKRNDNPTQSTNQLLDCNKTSSVPRLLEKSINKNVDQNSVINECNSENQNILCVATSVDYVVTQEETKNKKRKIKNKKSKKEKSSKTHIYTSKNNKTDNTVLQNERSTLSLMETNNLNDGSYSPNNKRKKLSS